MKFRRTTLLSIACVGVLAGVGLAKLSLVGLDYRWWLISLILTAVVFRAKNLVALVSILFFGITLGWWRGGEMLMRVNQYEALFNKPVVLSVKADSDGTYTDKSQIIFDASRPMVVEPDVVELPGRLTVSGFGTADIRRGDIVRVEGKMFPTRGGKQARISFAQLKVVLRSSSLVEKIRRDFLAGLRSVLPEPQASFGTGLLLGGTRDLPDNNVESLRRVGLSHIIAVSGYNLTILADVFGGRVGKRSKFRGLVLSMLLVGLFILLAGSSASISRAAVVALLTQIAAYYGRKFKPLLLILSVAALSVLTNPLNLWSDIGWYLSFLAFYGVLVLAPLIQKRFFRSKPSVIKGVIIESFSAQLMTIPYVLFVFSQVSLISLIANVLVVPFIPLAMLLVTVAGVGWLILPWPTLTLWLAWPATALLTFMLDIASLLSRFSLASVNRSLSLVAMLLCYGLIAGFTFILANRQVKTTEVVLE